ncbi:MAG: DNA internalization-related competence protein ComEC/Rec2 [Lachnospiraceae bacterium]|nr:MAG: DNA internalization-related competence protein ComEC/Rec2 [Lachnospiraceae bacterium]
MKGESHMYKRPVLITAVSMLSAVCIVLIRKPILFAVPFCLLPFIFYRRKTRSAIALCAVVAASFAAGLLSAHIRLSSYEKIEKELTSTTSSALYGQITGKEITDYGTKMTITLRSQQTKVMAIQDTSLPLGTKVRVTGTPESFSPVRNPGCFDQASYYKGLSVACQIRDADITPSGGTNFPIVQLYFMIMEALWQLKYMIYSVFTAALPNEEGPLLASLTIGTKSLLDSYVKEMFQSAGLSHILAISGLHISITGSLIFKLLKRLGIRTKISAIISSVFVFFFAASISGSVSCRRALVMYLLMMLSKVIGDKIDIVNSLAAVSILICLTDPLAVTQTAFSLSFAAVFLLAQTSIPAADCYRAFCILRWENTHKEIKGNRYKPTALDGLTSSLIFSFFIQLSMAAVNAKFFYSFPLLSFILNIVILPLLPCVLVLGLLGGVLGLFSLPLAKILLFPCHLIMYWYEMASDLFNKLPFTNIVTGDISVLKTVICLAVVLMLSYIFKNMTFKMFKRRFTRIHWQKTPVFPLFGDKATALKVTLLSFTVIIILSFPNHRDEFAFLDVGQGDGLMITTADGKAFMIDGGSTTEKEIGKNVILPSLKYRGITGVEGWFVTHMDEDHVNGLTELINKNYPVNTVFISEHIEEDERLSKLISLCASHGIKISGLEGGDSLGCRYFKAETIYPDRESEFEGANENSLVNLFTLSPGSDQSIKIIETGDIGGEQELYILEHAKDKLKKSSAEETLILKSAHHGSNYSNCQRWLSEINPDLIVISAGKGNRYGHPGKQTMERINTLGLKSFCTIDTGQVRIQNGRIKKTIAN